MGTRVILKRNASNPSTMYDRLGWKDMKTMQIYIRKAGINIKGITDCLDFED